MKRRDLVLSLLLVGLCLVGLGLTWDHLVPSSVYWGPAQADELIAAQIEMHKKSHQHGADAEKEMAIARERYVKLSQQLESARGSQNRIGTFFLVAGISLLLAGIVLHMSQANSTGS
jgi:hypothetical protein